MPDEYKIVNAFGLDTPKIKTKVVHSTSRPAWNVVNTKLGGKHKIAIIPYVSIADSDVTETNRAEAWTHANFISKCFNAVV